MGLGATDQYGYVQANLTNCTLSSQNTQINSETSQAPCEGIDAVENNPAFETESGDITIAVYYSDPDTSDQTQAFTATENLGAYVDPILQEQTLTSDGAAS